MNVMQDYKHERSWRPNPANKPANKPAKRETFAEVLAFCLFMYGLGLTLFLFGLRQAGVL